MWTLVKNCTCTRTFPANDQESGQIDQSINHWICIASPVVS